MSSDQSSTRWSSPGSVLLIRFLSDIHLSVTDLFFVMFQVSILSPLGRNHYLNITPNNVVRLYPRNECGSESSLGTLKLRDLTPDDLAIAVPLPPAGRPVPISHTVGAGAGSASRSSVSLVSPVRPSAVRPVSSQSFSTPSRLNSPRVPYGSSPASAAVSTPRTSTRPQLQQNASYARPVLTPVNRPSAGAPSTALQRLPNNNFIGSGSPVIVNSRHSFIAGNQNLSGKTTTSSVAAARSSFDFPRTVSATAVASPGTSKFTFKRASAATPTTAVSDRSATCDGSSSLKSRYANAAAEANRQNQSSVSNGCHSATTVDKELPPADLWKTDGKSFVFSFFLFAFNVHLITAMRWHQFAAVCLVNSTDVTKPWCCVGDVS